MIGIFIPVSTRDDMRRLVEALKQIEVPCIGRHPGLACVTPLGRENDWYFYPGEYPGMVCSATLGRENDWYFYPGEYPGWYAAPH
jgi:hypothetical protein